MDLLGVDVVQQVLVVQRPQTGNWIPALGGIETLTAGRAAVFRADVVADGDIIEVQRVGGMGLVQERVQETQRLAGLLDLGLVQQGHDRGNDRGRGRRTADGHDRTGLDDDVVVTDGRNVRETTRRSIVV